jgi:hypothetical protein
MDKATVQAMLTRMFEEMDPDVEYVMRHPDFVADMPQSGSGLPAGRRCERCSAPSRIHRRSRFVGS